MTTNVDITNRALAEIGSRSQIASMNDGSAEATYANLLYNDLRDFMLREGDYDFAMSSVTLGASSAAVTPWLFYYAYPASALRIRQLIPNDANVLDPQPVEWSIGAIGASKVIFTRKQVSTAWITIAVGEDQWDSIFTESFVRFLGSALTFALQNRIEASKEKLNEALSFAGIANMRDS